MVGWEARAGEIEDRLRRAFDDRAKARVRVRRLETALLMIRDREWVENALDPQWAAQVARDALKEDV